MALATSRPPVGDRSGRGPGAWALGVLRGLLAVGCLLARAVAALLGAALAVPPDLWTRIGHAIADEYRAGRVGAIDAEVLDDPDPQPGEGSAGHDPFDMEVCR
ncbi:hypothetical protein Acsp03_27480 [Actinomadura sp. NBRC 104412]|uniref:hypothetical protein n=1 Tax=unclassified Actinomadura TaxID=2626254 RepID=UPI0024A17017|nr:hypothetical protein [Actinomadura sp. NBRC 104412]GLZ05282.1 hypothetical protein Acsp03_27480 [Actinomadura sp. NBRC 104412]